MIASLGVSLWFGVLISSFLVYQQSQKQNQVNWAKWQSKMAGAFKQTEGLTGDPTDRVQAWEKFLASYAKDNPFSAEDENLRAKAETHLQEAVRIAQQKKNAAQERAAQAAIQQQQRAQAVAQRQQEINNQIGNALIQRVLR